MGRRMAHRFDATTASCRILTFKEGLLSAVAHDLELAVRRFEGELDPGARTVEATFDATSIEVVGAVQDGRVATGVLGSFERGQITKNMAKDVLKSARYPTVRFVSVSVEERGDAFRVRGELTLVGRTRPLVFDTRREGDQIVARVRLHQPEFGITPYSALLGAIKLKPDLEVELRLPAALTVPS
jgi:polyisoprenoid-binding protein YceI